MRKVGFILQATYRIISGMPVVYLYGRHDDGSSFLIRDHRQRPHFYVATAHRDAALAAGAVAVVPTDQRTFDGLPVARVEVRVPQDAPTVRDQLHNRRIDTFEADVRFAMRYLIDRNVRAGCEIEGEPAAGDGLVDWVWDDPEVRPGECQFAPRVLSFDIETNPHEDRLLAISMWGCGLDEVLIYDPDGRAMPERATGLASERDLLERFCEQVRQADPDVLTGWNVIDFDLTFLLRVARRVGQPLALGRDRGSVRLRPAQGYFGSGQATIPGRLVLDGPDLLRGAAVRMDSYSLDAVSRVVLGEGKAVEGDVQDRIGEILDGWRSHLPRFALYARTDARLALQILEALDLFQLAVARSRLTGMPLDRVAASVASFDFVYLAGLQQRRLVAPSVDTARDRMPQAGGHVFTPRAGLHEQVWVFDYRSLYPSIMRTFNIDPVAFTDSPGAADLLLASGAGFRRGEAILPAILTELFAARAQARGRGDQVASQAIKILMNSFYGVLGTPGCRFFNPAIANAITRQGRYFLEWARDWFAVRGHALLYGDTDSVFVLSNQPDPARAHDCGAELCAAFNRDLEAHVAQRWGISSHLELEYEKLYRKLFLSAVRGGGAGASKRYVGLRDKPGAAPDTARDIEFVGMELVRRDWTGVAKVAQRELYVRLFDERPVDDWLADYVRAVRAGEHDDALVYTKGLRRSPAEYGATSPPHVVAARKSARRTRTVHYVVTVAGPEPLDALVHEPDREHYVDRQIRPVAEPVLAALGLEFDRVTGDDRQIALF